MARQYYKIGLDRNCPDCLIATVILMDVEDYTLWDHCGDCRRSWKHDRPLSIALEKVRDKKIAQIELAKKNAAGFTKPFDFINKQDTNAVVRRNFK